MKLRDRLLIVIALLLATYAVVAMVIVSSQRKLLIDQVDQRLAALPPGAFAQLPEPPPPSGEQGVTTTVTAAPEAAFSNLYISFVDGTGDFTPLLAGSMPGGVPNAEAAVQATDGVQGIVTVPAVDGEARFRALVLPQVNGSWLVTAQSLAEIDAALDRLVRTLWIAGAIIAGVLTIAVTWVHRLGLRPIARVTAIAEAIAAGDHSRRVALTNTRTEAGKLGYAFNLMLDERDAAETRLRQFVADASHELRTPLTSMRGYLELYRQGAFREPGRLDDVVRRLSAESSRMHGLVEDLLALASLDEDRPFQREPVDVGQLLRDAAQDGQATQPDRAIAVIAPRPGPVVTGDTALLTQLVGILVANALAHTPVSVPITLSADAHAATVTITVADRGPGLDSGAADRVFDRFWRGEAARTRSTGGTGLGLAIARSITDAHGGTISLETAPGEGCTFTVHLPRVTSNVGVSPSAS